MSIRKTADFGAAVILEHLHAGVSLGGEAREWNGNGTTNTAIATRATRASVTAEQVQ